ncbi:GyrI-like domain-containing protein [Mucilaginibacter pedocola]|uniref:GyrI-like small molecule binding domain-containing protein n=1 Tax=Mucilaginibacter pedocola TaxID=1792845 RepID=A0A1S9PJ89_9SPHI|nr:GyrI-like domain-containing protein [Mucilaginibacter pedocola]OOQ61013.1 hypothetical protein BC343_21410 [Mucilaginibacter pedocola]
MKKPALLVLGILLLAFISIYFIIPQYITAKSSISVDATDGNVFRFLVQKKAWPKWWPGEHNAKDTNIFTYNGTTYTIKKDANSFIELGINTGKVQLDSKLNYLAENEVATTINWEGQMQSSLNPFTRISEFVRIKAEQQNMDTILSRFKTFMQTDTNVYGLRIKVEHVKDGLMLATNKVFKATPTVTEVYDMVAGLRKEIAVQNAAETNKPMLNINQTDDNEYHVMVAIPINKEIKPGANSVVNKMAVGGNILKTEVKGGRKSIDNAFTQLQNFRKDYKLTGVAMPFELMVTDRSMEKDTAKWVTRLYWPIL